MLSRYATLNLYIILTQDFSTDGLCGVVVLPQDLRSYDPEFEPRSNRASEKGRQVVLALRTSEEHMRGYRPLWPRQPNKPL